MATLDPPCVGQKDVLRDAGRQETIFLSLSDPHFSASSSSVPTAVTFSSRPLSPIPSLRLLSPTRCSAVSFAKKIVFISTVVRMDSVPVIYVSAQTHLIYSAKHNSLTLFWGKALIYLGYATKSRELQRLAHSYQQFRLLLYLSPIFYIRRSSLDLLGSRFDLGFTLYHFGTTVSLFLSDQNELWHR